MVLETQYQPSWTDLADYGRETKATSDELTRQRDTVQRECLKWADQAMSGAVPGDIARDKQKELAVKLAAVDEKLAAVSTVQADHERPSALPCSW